MLPNPNLVIRSSAIIMNSFYKFSFIFGFLLFLTSCVSSSGYDLNIGFEFTKKIDKPINITGFIHKRSDYGPGFINEVLVSEVTIEKELYPHSHLIVENLIDILENQQAVENLVLFAKRDWINESAIHIHIEIFEEAFLDPNYGHRRYDLEYSFSEKGRPTFRKRIKKSSAGFGGCLKCIPRDLVINRINREMASDLHEWL